MISMKRIDPRAFLAGMKKWAQIAMSDDDLANSIDFPIVLECRRARRCKIVPRQFIAALLAPEA